MTLRLEVVNPDGTPATAHEQRFDPLSLHGTNFLEADLRHYEQSENSPPGVVELRDLLPGSTIRWRNGDQVIAVPDETVRGIHQRLVLPTQVGD